jgi:hypothetical protein
VETPEVDGRMLDEIVTAWEDEYDQLLADIKQRMQNNEASEEEAQQLINLERIVLIYDLMMGGEIERRGFWSHDGSTHCASGSLEKLAGRISQSSNKDIKELCRSLDHAHRNGHLTCSKSNGYIRWEWANHL